MRKLFYLKALMLSLCMAVSFVLPVNAQRNDNFIGWEENNGLRDTDPITIWTATNGITNQDFNDTPLGSGLLIMVTAGAGYAVARRRSIKGVKAVNGFKGFNAIIIAFALFLGMTQCKKKDVETINPSNRVQITLNVDNDSRYTVYPHVTFEDNDYIAVGYKGNYVGLLKYSGTQFTGTVTLPATPAVGDEDEPLYFYFIGYMTSLLANQEEGETPNITVQINNQTSGLPVLSCGQSTQPYSGGGNEKQYSSILYNKCALVKFILTNETDDDVILNGVSNTIKVDFANHNIVRNNIQYSNNITLKKDTSTEFWAIMLPSNDALETTATIGSNNYGITIPALAANDYVEVEIDNSGSTPTPVSGKYFKVADNKYVEFAKGNLKYYNNSWSFADHQWECLGTWSASGTIDLMGFGTWNSNSERPNSSEYDNQQFDWNGDYNGGPLDDHNDWYTLSANEWNYLLNERNNASSKRGIATLTGPDPDVKGLVILTEGQDANVLNGTYNASEWAAMEEAGAAFLPMAGNYYYDDGWCHDFGKNYLGAYWTSTTDGNGKAKAMAFIDNEIGVYSIECFGPAHGAINVIFRSNRQSVRLVRVVTPSSK